MPQQKTGPAVSSIANTPTKPEEVTPIELQVTLCGNPSEAATTTVEPTGLQLGSGFINKTSLEAIPYIAPLPTTSGFIYPTGIIKRLSSVEGRRPQYQEKGASVVSVWNKFPTSATDKTTVSGKSDDPIKLGDDLKYQKLTDRVEKLDNSVAELKNMLQQLLQVQKVQSTVVPPQAPALQQAPATNELWNLFQPYLHHQAQLADQQLTSKYFSYQEIFAMLMPLIFDQFFISVIALLTTAMISSSSQESVSAVSLVSPLYMMIYAVYSAISSAGTVIIAQYKEHGDEEKMKKAAGQIVMFTFATAVVELSCRCLL